MKQFSLEEYLKNPNQKVVTRDGRKVTILCTNYSTKPIIAEIEDLGHSYSFFLMEQLVLKVMMHVMTSSS